MKRIEKMYNRAPLFMRSVYLLVIILGSCLATSALAQESICYDLSFEHLWNNSPYFNTTFLSYPQLVAKTLTAQEGFKTVHFSTPDGIQLNGLFRQCPDARYTAICCAGFYPGRKETLAPLMLMHPTNCNLLFFDARGHGTSQGKFLTNLHRYGMWEYNDLVGAITFIHENTDAPIILHGICAGAFHAARALIELTMQGSADQYRIKGLIFDSGFGSLASSLHVPHIHLEQKMLPIWIALWYSQDKPEQIKQRYLYRMARYVTTGTMRLLAFVLNPFVKRDDEQTNIWTRIGLIKCPILFIHARNDSYTPFEQALQLAHEAQYPQVWWLDDSEHAVNHLKHKQAYKEHTLAFIKQVLLVS